MVFVAPGAIHRAQLFAYQSARITMHCSCLVTTSSSCFSASLAFFELHSYRHLQNLYLFNSLRGFHSSHLFCPRCHRLTSQTASFICSGDSPSGCWSHGRVESCENNHPRVLNTSIARLHVYSLCLWKLVKPQR